MVNKIFIEGDNSEVQAPSLRQAFSKLINSKLGEKRVRIKMGGGVSQTCNSFKDFYEDACLLIDLHGPEENRNAEIKNKGLEKKAHDVFFMVQSMEAWFLSQAKTLDEHFGTGDKISNKFNGKNPMKISKPGDELSTAVANARGKKKEYHKTRDGAEIIFKLDPNKLYQDFPDFKNLIDKLNAR